MKGCYVFSCFIDLKKVFDTVYNRKLFEILLAKTIPRCFIRVLCNMYFSQRLKACWYNAVSDVFECNNGVSQGSSLSPFLYSIYIDGVLNKIAKTNTGCKIAVKVWNCLAYADEIVLFASSWRD